MGKFHPYTASVLSPVVGVVRRERGGESELRESRVIVTGPSLTSETSIIAPKTPSTMKMYNKIEGKQIVSTTKRYCGVNALIRTFCCLISN